MYDVASGDPGLLGTRDGFRRFLTELLSASHLGHYLPAQPFSSVGRVSVMTHSGGYIAAAMMSTIGGVNVNQIVLLDSLYGNSGDYTTWLTGKLNGVTGNEGCQSFQFADFYSSGGGTDDNSRALAANTRALVRRRPNLFLYDDTTGTQAADVLQRT